MNPYRIYTRKIMGLDNRVWRLMFAMILLPLGLLSYRLMSDKEQKCEPFSFAIRTLALHSNDFFYTGETISFIASDSSNDIDWNFDDNSTDAGTNVHHQYLKEGNYYVTATGSALCATGKEIRIVLPPAIVHTSDSIRGRIAGLTSFNTFTDQKFTYPGTAKSYVWSVQNHPIFSTKSGQTVSFNFALPGSYTIQVELDSDMRKRDYFDVNVRDEVKKSSNPHPGPITVGRLPDPGPIEKPVVIDTVVEKAPNKPKVISAQTFVIYLGKVQTKEMTMAQFEQYGIVESTPVVANGKEHQTFGWLCQEIVKTKKKGLLPIWKKTEGVHIQSANLQRINGLVSIIEVNYDYKK